jgi:hypothetical protein
MQIGYTFHVHRLERRLINLINIVTDKYLICELPTKFEKNDDA